MTVVRTRKPTRRARQRRYRRRLIGIACLCVLAAVLGLALGVWMPRQQRAHRLEMLAQAEIPDWISPALLDIGNARSGEPLADFTGVVIHYVGNPGTTAIANRNYFAQEDTEVCSHFVVGLQGEIVQCVPLGERSAASNSRNRDTISIEVCHPDEEGRFRPATYAAVVKLTAWLCDLGGLDETAVIRHYDVSGKECPLYYVRHEDAWVQLRQDVAEALTTT